MKIIRLIAPIIAVAFCPAAYGAESLPKDTLRLMDNLSRNCQALHPFPKPIPEPRSPKRWEVEEQMRYIERDLEKLRQLDEAAERSSRIIRGKPFNATLQAALKIIEANRLALKSTPDPKALSAIDDAIFEGRMGIKWVTNPTRYNATLAAMSEKYASYQKAKARAEALDPKVLEVKKKELDECEEKFVKPFLALREKREQEAELKASVAEAVHRADTTKRRSEAKEEGDLKRRIAKAHGASGYYDGVASIIEQLTMGVQTVEQAKALLIFVAPGDSFEVVSTSPEHVFYRLRRPYDDPVQIAVERTKGDFYGQGAPLQQTYYRIVGVNSFRTVSGADADLVIFKGCPPTPGETKDAQSTHEP